MDEEEEVNLELRMDEDSEGEFDEESDDPDWHLGENFVSASEDSSDGSDSTVDYEIPSTFIFVEMCPFRQIYLGCRSFFANFTWPERG